MPNLPPTLQALVVLGFLGLIFRVVLFGFKRSEHRRPIHINLQVPRGRTIAIGAGALALSRMHLLPMIVIAPLGLAALWLLTVMLRRSRS